MQNEMAGKRACIVVESFEEVLATSRHSRAVVEFNFGHRPEQIHALCGPNGNDFGAPTLIVSLHADANIFSENAVFQLHANPMRALHTIRLPKCIPVT